MPEHDRQVLWEGPEHGDGETLARAYRRLAGRDFDPQRCVFEDVRGSESTFVFKDVEVTVRHGGRCSISRAGGGGGGGAG
jgi:hypothetical protein